MGYPTKVQQIRRKKTADQYYINFPTAVAEAMEFEKGEVIEWIIEDKANIIAHRRQVPPSPVTIKKTCASPRRDRSAPESVRGFGWRSDARSYTAASALPVALPGTTYADGGAGNIRTAVLRLERRLQDVFSRPYQAREAVSSRPAEPDGQTRPNGTAGGGPG